MQPAQYSERMPFILFLHDRGDSAVLNQIRMKCRYLLSTSPLHRHSLPPSKTHLFTQNLEDLGTPNLDFFLPEQVEHTGELSEGFWYEFRVTGTLILHERFRCRTTPSL